MRDKKQVLVLATTFPRWKNDVVPAFVYELSKRLGEKEYKITKASIYDLLPTFLQIFNIPIPKDLDGNVLIDLFEK